MDVTAMVVTKELAIVTPERARCLGFQTETPVFTSLFISSTDRCPDGCRYGPLRYAPGRRTVTRHTCGYPGIYHMHEVAANDTIAILSIGASDCQNDDPGACAGGSWYIPRAFRPACDICYWTTLPHDRFTYRSIHDDPSLILADVRKLTRESAYPLAELPDGTLFLTCTHITEIDKDAHWPFILADARPSPWRLILREGLPIFTRDEQST